MLRVMISKGCFLTRGDSVRELSFFCCMLSSALRSFLSKILPENNAFFAFK